MNAVPDPAGIVWDTPAASAVSPLRPDPAGIKWDAPDQRQSTGATLALPRAEAETPAAEPKFGDIFPAVGAGVVQSVRDLSAAPAALKGQATPQPTEQPYYTEPLGWTDLIHPKTAAPKIAYVLSKSLPMMVGGIGGGMAGAALGAEAGPGAIIPALAGGALGAGAVSAVQSLAPYFAAEMAKSGANPDAAYTNAIKKAAQEGAFSAAGWAAFGIAPFQSAAKNLLFQAAGVQPLVAMTAKGTENVQEGHPITEGLGDVIPGAVAGTAIPMAGHAAVTRARQMFAARPPLTPPPITEPVPEPPIQPTPERGAEAPQQSALDVMEALRNAPVEQADQAARDALVAAATPKPPQPPAAAPPVEPPPQPRQGPSPAWSAPVEAPPESTPQAPEIGPPSGAYVMLDPEQLRIDPARFQFKASDERGVTGALHGINRFEPALANPITAWQDHDGAFYVVNGHQRTDLATRAKAAGQEGVQIPTRIFRAEDGYTPEYMRVLGAYQNIAEGSGTAIDAAKVLRGSFPPSTQLPELPPKQAMVIQGRALAKLSPEAFGVVENGVVPPEYAAAVGDRIADPREQMAALDVLARAQPANANQARLMVEDIRNSGFLQGSQTTLFGDEAFAKSLVAERARVLDNAMRTLRRVKGVFKAAVEGEETLTGAGNQLDAAANVRGKTENERLLDTIGRDATTRGPLSDALTEAARDLAGGKPVSVVAPRFLAAARKIVARGPSEGIPASAPADRAGLAGESEAGTVADSNQAPMFGRRLPTPPAGGAPLFGVEPRSVQPRREAEPTIRNDARQVDMFGRADAAVQAQAARDQAGRGAIGPRGEVKPADEGLFAPKKPPQGTMFQRAWQGSPHDHAGHDVSKIGTGEGNQAFGWGHYFAGKRAVGEYYRAILSHGFSVDGVPSSQLPKQERIAAGIIARGGTTLDKMLSNWREGERIARRAVETARGKYDTDPMAEGSISGLTEAKVQHEYTKEVLASFEALKGKKIKEGGHLYHVEIPEDHMLLDRDKPVIDQPPHVRAFLERELRDDPTIGRDIRRGTATGGGAYSALSEKLGGDRAASEALRDAGIPGLRYLDQGSRTAGEGSHNYVIFDDKAVSIVDKFKRGDATDPAPHDQAVQAAVDAAMKMTGNRVKIEAYDKDHGVFRVKMPDGSTEQVFGYALGRLIRAAIEPGYTIRNINHEVLHVLRNLGVFTKGEWKVLEATAKRENWAKLYKIDERYPDLDAAGRLEEAIAEHFSHWITRAPTVTPTLMGRLVQKMQQFIARLREALALRGFHTAEDVFGRAERGEVGAREPGSGMEQKGPRTIAESEAAVREWGQDNNPAFGRRDRHERLDLTPVGKDLSAVEKAKRGFLDTFRSAFAPISTGNPRAQAEAAKFANSDAKVANWLARTDKALRTAYTPEQRTKMFGAMDDQSLFEIELREAMQGKTPEDAAAIETAARDAFKGRGLESLPEAQRNIVTELDAVQGRSWDAMRERGLVDKGARRIPFRTPRAFVQALGEGKAARLPTAGEGGQHAIDPLGLNLTTAGTMRREYRITEESLAALRKKYADADLVRDIRVLPTTLAKEMRSVHGVDLVNAIRDYGRDLGFDPVTSDVPVGQGGNYKTIDHPALMETRPAQRKNAEGEWETVKGDDGKAVMVRTPMKVHADFEGPLRAVLTRPESKLYSGLLGVKNAAVGMIMYSPMIHNVVEWSRALPVMGMNMLWFKPYIDGHRLGRDFKFMGNAIDHGLRPVGGSWKTDATGIYEASHGLTPGNSAFAKAMGAAGDVVSKDLGNRIRGAIDTAGEFWHQKLLWDQVRALQVGIYDGMLKSYIAKGHSPDVAAYMAAHLANRYAGSLPREALSNAANMAANLGMFSRSFTLGNLGAMKDMLNGMPSYVRAQIERAAGPAALKGARADLKRKAIAAFVMDLGLTYIGNALLQNVIQMALGEQDLDEVAQGYFRRFADVATGRWESMNPLENLTPNADNEPGKKGRVYAGRDATGTAGYFRNPLGKIGEDFAGWLTNPLTTAMNKAAPMPRAIMESLTNVDGQGKAIRNKDSTGMLGALDNAGEIVTHLAKSFIPVDALASTWGALRDGVRAATGQSALDPHPEMQAARALGPALGVQTSRGYPGGPQEGEKAALLRNYQFDRARAVPIARAMVQKGDTEGALEYLQNKGLSPRDAALTLRGIMNPERGAHSREKQISRFATPEQRAVIDRLRPTAP